MNPEQLCCIGIVPLLPVIFASARTDNSPNPIAWIILIVIGIVVWKVLTRTPESQLKQDYGREPGKTIKKIVEEWPATVCGAESDYEKQLTDFLRNKLAKIAKVKPQQGSGSTRNDIQIDKKVALELKVNLTSTNKLQRLIGQLNCTKKKWTWN